MCSSKPGVFYHLNFYYLQCSLYKISPSKSVISNDKFGKVFEYPAEGLQVRALRVFISH